MSATYHCRQRCLAAFSQGQATSHRQIVVSVQTAVYWYACSLEARATFENCPFCRVRNTHTAPVPLGLLPRKTGSAGEIVTSFGRGRFQYPRFASRGWDAGLRYPLVRGPLRVTQTSCAGTKVHVCASSDCRIRCHVASGRSGRGVCPPVS